MSDRNAALDRARTFITVLVLANHTVVAYTAFGRFYPNHYLWSTAPIVDAQKWIGFNLLTLFNDAFFMSLMFLLSGLFVWPSLQRKGVGHFLRDRALRLGVPFLAAILLLMPIAYYASFSLTPAKLSFGEFWLQNVRSGIWFDGPTWFIWFLLLLDLIAIPVVLLAPGLITAINRLSTASTARPWLFVGALFVASAIAYVPMLFHFGAVSWFNFGPLQVQASRVVLYGVFFFAGMGIGAADIDKGLLARAGHLARHWWAWVAMAAVAFTALTVLINFRRMRLGNLAGAPPFWWQSSYGVVYALACVTISVAILALFLRFAQGEKNLLDPLRADAYGIYVFHYIPCLWLQYALLPSTMHVSLKVLIVFVGTLASSWAVTAALRRIPGATRIL
ncbi:acyltransferase family protein [Bradyrhizobium sp. U87765 SZCCT0131]|uniref:acyltransferase family protein n=1 Tax=unclassified Bradyrhizobium TaxID=2631580 RepID=UPI001BA81D92|nr:MULTISPECIES: acyltransferase family protein [unclassified Bradyrhizobium]MBR1222828.1 acyltransferase family protein [Bradyrhizobium sp. U87765 SZCCT0131]MBR1262564.1 acyltransferase family protein [Bradyrhizobium sp. U87765 SZCCT0134]MBR1308964.1 acyltransferase family protein [Bradyrhizobium sp. U87765 SZCCT0110]MBR1318346.1 acyltransferase family protein [Bradyrhizobium sp. U87765 SZCCT0109]MBR1352050.1 acyltransferase family protein [Bradyrhizobium sp. U87765 SZCCT0048]